MAVPTSSHDAALTATIKLGATATKKVNREGDPILPGAISLTSSGATLTFSYTPPGGAATTQTLANATASGVLRDVNVTGEVLRSAEGVVALRYTVTSRGASGRAVPFSGRRS